MSRLPSILICESSVRDDVNATLEALGRGPNNVSRALCSIDPEATHETPATHYMMQDMSTHESHVLTWTGLIEGAVPEVDDNGDPVAWGLDGIISEQDVVAAWGNGNVRLIARAGFSDESDGRPREERPPTQTEWRDETLAQEGLQFVPYEPV